jgi:excisionase family DNA binding protein
MTDRTRNNSNLERLDALPAMLTVTDGAELLRTTSKAIYAMADRGQLPGITRIGRRLLFRSADLVQWLDRNRAPSSKEA